MLQKFSKHFSFYLKLVHNLTFRRFYLSTDVIGNTEWLIRDFSFLFEKKNPRLYAPSQMLRWYPAGSVPLAFWELIQAQLLLKDGEVIGCVYWMSSCVSEVLIVDLWHTLWSLSHTVCLEDTAVSSLPVSVSVSNILKVKAGCTSWY